MTRPFNSIEATLLNERRASLRADGTLGAPISLTKITDACARCLADCAPTGSWSIEPLCTACIHDLKASEVPPMGLTDDDMILILRIR